MPKTARRVSPEARDRARKRYWARRTVRARRAYAPHWAALAEEVRESSQGAPRPATHTAHSEDKEARDHE